MAGIGNFPSAFGRDRQPVAPVIARVTTFGSPRLEPSASPNLDLLEYSVPFGHWSLHRLHLQVPVLTLPRF